MSLAWIFLALGFMISFLFGLYTHKNVTYISWCFTSGLLCMILAELKEKKK